MSSLWNGLVIRFITPYFLKCSRPLIQQSVASKLKLRLFIILSAGEVSLCSPILLDNLPIHSKNVPAIQTPIEGLFFASMSQVYPWDRGTNFAVEIGRRAARMIIEKTQA